MAIIISALLLMGIADKPECRRWAWSGDVYNRTVWCLEWSKPPPKKEDKKKNA